MPEDVLRDVLTYPAACPAQLRGAVVAIGNFDGVHAGHRALLTQARALAGAAGRVMVLTFDPHPRQVLTPAQALRPLMTMAEKVAALEAAGADAVAVLPFDAQVAGWTPEVFMKVVLQEWLGVRAVCVGENFRFGRQAAGTVETLRQASACAMAFATVVVPLLRDGQGEVISSRRLRAVRAAEEG